MWSRIFVVAHCSGFIGFVPGGLVPVSLHELSHENTAKPAPRTRAINLEP